MPVALSYPDVYTEAVPSEIRTITGVATSITAFMGRARLGPVNEPITITRFDDFERQFGGLAIDCPLSYAVRDFYLNGGSQAIIVRLYKDPASAHAARASIVIDGLSITAKNPGTWGKKLRASIDVEVSDEVRTRLGLTPDEVLFNLTIRLGNTVEKFLHLNIAATDNARRIDRVLKAESSLVSFSWPDTTPTLTNTRKAAAAFRAFLDTPNAENRKSYAAAKAKLDDPATQAEKNLAVTLTERPQVPDTIIRTQEVLQTIEFYMHGSDGEKLDQATYTGSPADKTGLYALDKIDLFNLLCIPPDTREGDTDSAVYQAAMAYCQERRAMLIVDSPADWSKNQATAAARDGLATLGLCGEAARNAALYFPRVLQADPLQNGQIDTFVPCGIIAGIMARTDTMRGVWKAPAGLDTYINGIQGVDTSLTDEENSLLNPLGINCLRAFPFNGRVIWGARTLCGADQLADEWKYIPVRRTALFIEESLYRGTQWVIFEPNDESLWAQIRLNIDTFMHNLFSQGAFQGNSPHEAYFVKCDQETTTRNDINLGIVNIVVGFAPLRPAEFVIIKLQRRAGQIEN